MVSSGNAASLPKELIICAGVPSNSRPQTLVELGDAALLFYRTPAPDAALLAQHLTDAVRPALADFAARCATMEWSKPVIAAQLKEVLAAHSLKMPLMAMPLRLLVTGQLQTPAIDAVLELFGRATVCARLQKFI